MSKHSNAVLFALALVLVASAAKAQQPTSQPPLPPGYKQTQTQQPQPAQQPNGPPQSGAPVRYLGPPVSIYDPLQQVAQATNLDLAKLRIDKWKTDGSNKQQAQEMAQSISRNLDSALPQILQQARASSNSLAAQFKLYHDLTAIYETFSTLTEAAASWGARQDAEALARDLNSLEQARRTLADYIQNLAAQNDAEIARLRSQAAAAQQQAVQQQQQKKVIVDDEQPAPKKKSSTKKKTAGTTASQPKPQPQQ